MKRNYKMFIDDIVQSIDKIERYTKDLDFDTFEDTSLIQDAVIRNLEIIGEATMGIPEEIRNKYKHVPWRQMKDLRNVMIHHYFGIDVSIVWNVVIHKLPELKQMMIQILNELDQ